MHRCHVGNDEACLILMKGHKILSELSYKNMRISLGTKNGGYYRPTKVLNQIHRKHKQKVIVKKAGGIIVSLC